MIMRQRKRQPIPKRVRDVVLQRDDRTCVYCGRREGQLLFPGPFRLKIHVDHLVPASQGGSSFNVFNLCCACASCNMTKSGKTPEEAGMNVAFVRNGFIYVDGEIRPEDWGE